MVRERTKKGFLIALACSLVAGISLAPAEAAKRKKKPTLQKVDTKFWLRTEVPSADNGGCYGDVNRRLSLAPPTSADGNCNIRGSGTINELLIAAGEDPVVASYPARDGVPVILDAKRQAKVELYLFAFGGCYAGSVIVEVSITGTIAGDEVELAAGSVEEHCPLPSPPYIVELSLKPPPKQHRAQLEGIELQVLIRGMSAAVSWQVRIDEGSSFLIVPALIKRIRR